MLEFENAKTSRDLSLEPFLCGKCKQNDFAVYGDYDSLSIYTMCKQCKQLNQLEFGFTQKDKPSSKEGRP